MKLVYIDESGDTSPISQNGSKFFTLTACIIDEDVRQKIEKEFRDLKIKFYGDPDIEFKSNFVRYANPDIGDTDSILKLHDRDQYNLLEAELSKYLNGIDVLLISCVIDKKSYWTQYPSKNPYEAAYMFILERVQMHLEENRSLGIVIIDPREGNVDKQLLGDNLTELHHKMRFENSHIWKPTPNIVERLLYSDSKNTIGIQLADLYGYPIYHIFEYSKEPKDYWRYFDITAKKFRRINGKLLGYGLKLFGTTKNGLE